MKWKVETLSKAVDDELEALDATFQAKFLHIAEMLESFGPENVKEPYCKSLGNKLWEIRMKGRPGIARAIYITTKNKSNCNITKEYDLMDIKIVNSSMFYLNKTKRVGINIQNT